MDPKVNSTVHIALLELMIVVERFMMSHFQVEQKDAFLMTSCGYDNCDNCRKNKEPESRVMYFFPYVRKLHTS